MVFRNDDLISVAITLLFTFVISGIAPAAVSGSPAPNSKKAITTTIAFGSCHKNNKSAVPSIWDSILREEPGAFVWTGDATYPSQRDPKTGKKRYGPTPPGEIADEFHKLKTNATIGYSQLLDAKVPIYGTWDDHDYGGNDMGKYMSNQTERQASYWHFLGYQPHDHAGIYHSIVIDVPDSSSADGDDDESTRKKNDHSINLILLDTRSFRDDHCIPSVAHRIPLGNVIACTSRWLTAGLHLWKYAGWWGRDGCEQAVILGKDQWAWFEDQLLNSKPSDLTIIVSSVQIWTSNPAMESWGHFPKEKERLWHLLERFYAEKDRGAVMFWSGDVHHGEISGGPGFLEVTSSGMTHHCGQPKLHGRLCRPILEHFTEHRLGPDTFYIGFNYGILQVDWEQRIATVEIKTRDGDTVLSVEQPLEVGENFRLPPFDQIPSTWDGHFQPLLGKSLVVIVSLFLSVLLLRRSKLKG